MKSKQKSLDKYVLYLETLNSSTINSLDDYVAENVRFKDPAILITDSLNFSSISIGLTTFTNSIRIHSYIYDNI